MPPHQDLSTNVTPPTIHEQLSTLIAISTANLHRLDAIISQMATVNTFMGIQTGTMAKLIPPPPPLQPPNQQPMPPLPTSTPSLPPPQQSLLPPPPLKPLELPMSTTEQQFLPPMMPPPKTTYIKLQKTIPANKNYQGRFQTNAPGLKNGVLFKRRQTDTDLWSYLRPPPWPDPSVHEYNPIVIRNRHESALRTRPFFRGGVLIQYSLVIDIFSCHAVKLLSSYSLFYVPVKHHQ
ncbi:unnamed protein product [Lactuca virosa]|uniref:Uncharacterized protein n=1 Tax=Lactuca virosa TaxID=75947 RepID=A0AAU9P113_9ASTR|nr:unnamed protein product [Lactuca virosa]